MKEIKIFQKLNIFLITNIQCLKPKKVLAIKTDDKVIYLPSNNTIYVSSYLSFNMSSLSKQ